jgi:hypothetical protein
MNIAQIAFNTCPDYDSIESLNNHPDKESLFKQWSNAITEELKKQGYYINKVKGDPSGRW